MPARACLFIYLFIFLFFLPSVSVPQQCQSSLSCSGGLYLCCLTQEEGRNCSWICRLSVSPADICGGGSGGNLKTKPSLNVLLSGGPITALRTPAASLLMSTRALGEGTHPCAHTLGPSHKHTPMHTDGRLGSRQRERQRESARRMSRSHNIFSASGSSQVPPPPLLA